MKSPPMKSFKKTKRERLRDRLLKAKERVRKLEKEWKESYYQETINGE